MYEEPIFIKIVQDAVCINPINTGQYRIWLSGEVNVHSVHDVLVCSGELYCSMVFLFLYYSMLFYTSSCKLSIHVYFLKYTLLWCTSCLPVYSYLYAFLSTCSNRFWRIFQSLPLTAENVKIVSIIFILQLAISTKISHRS